MDFFAIIKSDKNILLWNKCISSLSLISDQIKFVISTENFLISAINSTKTTYSEIKLERNFFSYFKVKFNDIKEISQEQEEERQSYSFLLNSKHSSILFRNLDAKELEYVCFIINLNQEIADRVRYKLMIEFKTQNEIVKNYEISYETVSRDEVKIESIYKQRLYDQMTNGENNDETYVYYFVIDYMVPKHFLDIVSVNTEYFMIESVDEIFLLVGYTNMILRDKEYLKQPMYSKITLHLDDLVESNFSAKKKAKKISFKLKDFRNFISLVHILTSAIKNSIESGIETNKKFDNFFHSYFSAAGNPIIFEKICSNVSIYFIQMTLNDNENFQSKTEKCLNLNTNLKTKNVLSNKNLHRSCFLNSTGNMTKFENYKPKNTSHIFLHETSTDKNLSSINTDHINRFYSNHNETDNNFSSTSQDNSNFVTYMDTTSSFAKNKNTSYFKRNLENDILESTVVDDDKEHESFVPSFNKKKKNYFDNFKITTEKHDKNDNTKKRKDKNFSDEEYGPTQELDPVKSIFN